MSHTFSNRFSSNFGKLQPGFLQTFLEYKEVFSGIQLPEFQVSLAGSSLLPCAPRPFRICNHDRSSRRGVVASSLQDLINKTLDALVITAGLITLVLEEDGTVVDTEDFFQSLGDNTQLMLLEKGQKWKPVSGLNYGIATIQQPKKMGVANFTLDLYKLNPKDFIGCLNVKATFYEIYSVSYDIKCTGAKSILR
uniref:Cell death inducing DFFA like effector a n=1 Tax=Laticauda laticaudata TaxID=8630 RepID=A0A8C5WRW8_LATLA